MKYIDVRIEVPDDWETRLDMQPHIEREIKADRWAWNWHIDRERFVKRTEAFVAAFADLLKDPTAPVAEAPGQGTSE